MRYITYRKEVLFLALTCLFVWGLSSCKESVQKRMYEEIFIDVPAKKDPDHAGHDHAGHDHSAHTTKASEERSPALEQTKDVPQDSVHEAVRAELKETEMNKIVEASLSKVPIAWALPSGWQEQPASGLRLATFSDNQEENPMECSIVTLGGNAGGLAANTVRWMQQVSIPIPEKSKFQEFIQAQESFQTAGGFPATLVNLASLQDTSDTSILSMAVTVVDAGDSTIFIKMTGTLQAVLDNIEPLKSLSQSIKRTE